jgi:hypothetical protein
MAPFVAMPAGLASDQSLVKYQAAMVHRCQGAARQPIWVTRRLSTPNDVRLGLWRSIDAGLAMARGATPIAKPARHARPRSSRRRRRRRQPSSRAPPRAAPCSWSCSKPTQNRSSLERACRPVSRAQHQRRHRRRPCASGKGWRQFSTDLSQRATFTTRWSFIPFPEIGCLSGGI